MVGPKKTLTDLRRIEAAVRVTCNECGHVRICDREALIHHRTRHRAGLDWASVRASLPCWNAGCGSKHTRVEALPFSQDRVELRRKRAETILMNLALSVLHAASYREKDVPIATPDVRLALRVLYPYLRDETHLRSYWAAAVAPRDHAWDSCHRPYEAIVAALLKCGLTVDAELR
ncbi:hypothetical protein [Sphingomonas glacialis]|uniref:hypothetical protein n=1 Tax=Sphingomonas glacialis TaxID=658225 RepID=UPI00112ED10E|nr:hypothetical protein [Sphingomonas glacialis]